MSSPSPTRYTDDNSVFFALTRMNPPTPGHLGLVKILINKAIEKGINHVYVCLSKTLDKGNPIECELKKKVLGDENQPFDAITMINSLKRKMIENTIEKEEKKTIRNMRIKVVCVSDEEHSPFHTIQNIIRNRIEAINKKNATDPIEDLEKINIFMVAGGDRIDFIDSVDKYYSNWPQVRTPILRDAPPRGGMTTFIEQTKTQEGIDALDIGLITKQEGWSGTMIRNIVIQGGNEKTNKPIFHKIYEGMLEPNVADTLYDAIWVGLNYNKSPKGATTKTKKSVTKTAKKTVTKKTTTKKVGGKRDNRKGQKKENAKLKKMEENQTKHIQKKRV